MKGKRTVAIVLSAMLTLGSLTTLTSCDNLYLLDDLRREISSDIKMVDSFSTNLYTNNIAKISWQDDIIGIQCSGFDSVTAESVYCNVYYKVCSEDYDNFISGFAENKTHIADIPTGKLEQLLNLTERYTILRYDKVDALNQEFNFVQFLENDTTIEK